MPIIMMTGNIKKRILLIISVTPKIKRSQLIESVLGPHIIRLVLTVDLHYCKWKLLIIIENIYEDFLRFFHPKMDESNLEHLLYGNVKLEKGCRYIKLSMSVFIVSLIVTFILMCQLL